MLSFSCFDVELLGTLNPKLEFGVLHLDIFSQWGVRAFEAEDMRRIYIDFRGVRLENYLSISEMKVPICRAWNKRVPIQFKLELRVV